MALCCLAAAGGTALAQSGTSGGCYWVIDYKNYFNKGVMMLIITPVEGSNGRMEDYSISSPAPWDDHKGSFTHVAIQPGVTHIGEYAFYGCTNITDIFEYEDGAVAYKRLAGSVTSIGAHAFEGCSSVTGYLAMSENLSSIGERAFYGCSLPGVLTIPGSVTSIGASAFEGCSGLVGVTIGSAAAIPSGAFGNCTSLSKVSVTSETPPNLHTAAFTGTPVDTVLVLCGLESNYRASAWNSLGAGGILTGGFTGECTWEISGDTLIIRAIPGGNGGMDGSPPWATCLSGIQTLDIRDGVTYIGSYIFYGHENFTGDLTIPNTVKDIGVAAFGDCSGFNGKLTISESLTTIQEYVFGDCSGITGDLRIPASVSNISGYAFMGCGFTGDLIFENPNMNEIGAYSFSYCQNFSGHVYIRSAVPPRYGSPFSYSSTELTVRLDTIHVHCAADYAGATGDSSGWWTNHSDIIKADIGPDKLVRVHSADPARGTAYVAQPNCSNDQATIAATPFASCIFKGWNDGSPENPRPVTVTTYDTLFTASFHAPDVSFSGNVSVIYDARGDSMTFSAAIRNTGSTADFRPPLYVAAYGDERRAGNAVGTDSVTVDIPAGGSELYLTNFVTVRNLSGALPFDRLYLSLNDRGEAAYVQPEENYADNVREIARNSLVLAHNDRASTVAGQPVGIPVLANDSIPAGSDPPLIETNGAHGTATVNGNTVRYVPAEGFSGHDTVAYRIQAGTHYSYAHIFIHVAEKPDNISDADADCVINPSGSWAITQDWASDEGDIYTHVVPLVGDMNGDGVPEIAVFTTAGLQSATGPYFQDLVKTVAIYDTRTHDKIRTITLPASIPGCEINPWGMVKTPTHGVLLVVATTDYHIYAYDYEGDLKWSTTTRNEPYGSVNGDFSTALSFADFNHDGTPELYLNNKIYNAATGRLLATATGGANRGASYSSWAGYTGWKSSAVCAADVLGTGNLQLIYGNEIYEVNIVNTADSAGNSLQRVKRIDPPAGAAEDGHTQVADFNRDGHLDVFISGRTAKGTGDMYFYVWDVYNNRVSSTLSPSVEDGKSLPLIGDFDGDNIPDVLIQYKATSANTISNCFKYNPASAAFFPLWNFQPTGGGANSTGATMFDFNTDGVMEVVLQDEAGLRIVDARNGTLLGSAAVFGATTRMQYPVIADPYGRVGDGSARLISVGNYGSSTASGAGCLNVLKPSSDKWAPARPVWNQVMYNSVNISDSLVPPAYPLNPATFFPGADHTPGTADDIQPFNSFLRQGTTLNTAGRAIRPAPDLKILSAAYDYHTDGDSLQILVEFANTGSVATATPLYLSAYRNTVRADSLMAVDSLMQPVSAGDTVQALITVRSFPRFLPLSTIHLRLNDRGEAAYVQAECDDSNNSLAGPGTDIRGLFNDLRTVQIFQAVEIDVLANDSLPAGFLSGAFSLSDSVTLPPRNGTLYAVGSGSGSRLAYYNTGVDSLAGGRIDSFRYALTFLNAGLGEWQRKEATVYIFILQDRDGSSTCPGGSHTASLVAPAAGSWQFDWYTRADLRTPAFTDATHTFGPLQGDTSMLIRPSMTGEAPWNRAGGFPAGEFTVCTDNPRQMYMRWTGLASSDWFNPDNWVEGVGSGAPARLAYEQPVRRAPSRCADVIVPSGRTYYPELTDPASCRGITLHDRAMLKNPHVLSYDSARVEIQLTSVERDRFVMWSAPLMEVYSGDYHFRDAANNPRFGDVYINYFQQANPATGDAARANMFTATFGKLNEQLGLGRAFNVRVTGTGESRTQPLIFPRTETVYSPVGQSQVSVTRSPSGRRFITDAVTLDGRGQFDLPVFGGDLNGHLVQVVNPYLAYLHADSFLRNNSDWLATGGYLFWNGKEENGFEAVKVGDTFYQPGMRYVYTGTGNLSGTMPPYYIPPLQSFFVAKKNAGTSVSAVKMSPSWTTTRQSDQVPYRLRAEEAESGVLHICATQGGATGYAALHFDKLQAVPEYRGSEDVRALFYDANPLAVYVLTPLREPLAISADGEYESHTTALGLRLTQSGEVTLEFSGQERFGHDVYLVDREPNREIFLQQTPSYTFTAVKPAGTAALELNDRFVLRMEYTGVGNAPVPAPPTWTATSLNGEIHVRTLSGDPIRSLRVYSSGGAAVYATQTAAGSFHIPAERGQVYIVTAEIGGTHETAKVIVK